MIERILPAGVVAAEVFDDPPEVELFAEEETVVARSVPKRRREFGTVRLCARAALAQLGLPPVPLVPSECGAPRWPAGVVGSMTHCAGYRAAAVAPAGDVAGIGVDAEPHEPLPAGVLGSVALAEERPRLRHLAAADPGVCWDRLLFSMKESVYKAWFPLTGRWLGFEDASVIVDPDTGAFSAGLLVPGPVLDGRRLTGFTGQFLVCDGLAITAVVQPRVRS